MTAQPVEQWALLLQSYLLLLVQLIQDLHFLPQSLALFFQPGFSGLQRVAVIFQFLDLVCKEDKGFLCMCTGASETGLRGQFWEVRSMNTRTYLLFSQILNCSNTWQFYLHNLPSRLHLVDIDAVSLSCKSFRSSSTTEIAVCVWKLQKKDLVLKVSHRKDSRMLLGLQTGWYPRDVHHLLNSILYLLISVTYKRKGFSCFFFVAF